MGKRKSRNADIRRLLQAGATYQTIADTYKLSKGRISQIISENNLKVNSLVIRDEKLSREMVKSDMDIQTNIKEIFVMQKSLLNTLSNAIQGDDGALERLQELGAKDVVSAMQRSTRDSIQAMESYSKIAQTAWNMEQSMNFQRRIIEAIKEVCTPEQTKKIIGILQEEKSLQNAVGG